MQDATPRRPGSLFTLAGKFGLIMATDTKGINPPEMLVNDDLPANQALPETGHWRVHRWDEPPRLVPRGMI